LSVFMPALNIGDEGILREGDKDPTTAGQSYRSRPREPAWRPRSLDWHRGDPQRIPGGQGSQEESLNNGTGVCSPKLFGDPGALTGAATASRRQVDPAGRPDRREQGRLRLLEQHRDEHVTHRLDRPRSPHRSGDRSWA
jgi:hypothetical protein